MAARFSRSLSFSFLLFFLLSLSLSSSASFDGPFIVAHKKASLKRLKSGKEHVLVSIDIYNEGSAWNHRNLVIKDSSTRWKFLWFVKDVTVLFQALKQRIRTAYDVSLTDDSWPQDAFDVISGKTSATWERLDAGAQVSHSFELEAKVKGQFQGAPAVIKYRVPTKAALQEAYSTPIFPLDILEERPPEKKLDAAKRFLAKYGSLISVILIVVLFVYLVASPSSASKASKKKR